MMPACVRVSTQYVLSQCAAALAVAALAWLTGCPGPEETEDAAAMDAARADRWAPDLAHADAGSPDALQPDASRPDSALPDSAQGDTLRPDAARPDGSAPDSSAPDTAVPDTSLPQEVFWLTLLHNNDSESALLASGDIGGVAAFTARVHGLRSEAQSYTPPTSPGEVVTKGVAMVSSGDSFLAGTAFNASLEHGVPFYETIAMDEIGYDAISLGNHDFDFGPDVLADFIGGFTTSPTFLAANLDFSAEASLQALVTSGAIARSTVLDLGGREVGLIGAVTPQLPYLSSIQGVTVGEVAAAVQAEVDALTTGGIGIIVLLSHLQTVTEDIALAPLLSGVDVIVAGGGHDLLASDGALVLPGDEARITHPYPIWADDADSVAVPIVTTAGLYRYVGRLVAKFDQAGALLEIDTALSGPARVISGSYPDAVTPDATVVASVTQPVQAAVDALAANVIGSSEVALDGIRTRVRTQETNQGDLIADALLWQATQLAASFGLAAPQVALQNAGGIRNNSVVGPGDISELDTFSMLPFSNLVAIVPDVPRAQLKELLENAVSRVEMVDGRFAQVAGLSFAWDGAGTAQVIDASGAVTTPGTRVQHVALADGTVIVDQGVVVAGGPVSIATIDFSARGGDQYPFHGAPFTIIGVTYQQALMSYIVTGLGGLIAAADYPEGGEGRITAVNVCGNGLIENVELCDDANLAAGDGCSASCATEAGFICSGEPSECSTVCSDGIIAGSEECDDGNAASGDGCSDSCASERALAGVSPASLSLLAGGGTGVVTVVLDGVAPANGIKVRLRSSATSSVAVPTALLVPEGYGRAGFRLRAAASAAASASVTVQLGSGTQTVAVAVVTAAAAPTVEDLVINEVHYDPNTDANCNGTAETGASNTVSKDEFVEVSNVSTRPLALSGVSLWDEETWTTPPARLTFDTEVLGPGESVVIFGGAPFGTVTTEPWCLGAVADSHIGDAVAVAAPGVGLRLSNSSDSVLLSLGPTNADAELADAVSWTGGSGTTRKSLVRSPDFVGDFVLHDDAEGHATDRHFTPGTLLTGQPFASANP